MPVQWVRVISSSLSRPQEIVPSPTPFWPCSSSSRRRKFLGTTATWNAWQLRKLIFFFFENNTLISNIQRKKKTIFRKYGQKNKSYQRLMTGSPWSQFHRRLLPTQLNILDLLISTWKDNTFHEILYYLFGFLGMGIIYSI